MVRTGGATEIEKLLALGAIGERHVEHLVGAAGADQVDDGQTAAVTTNHHQDTKTPGGDEEDQCGVPEFQSSRV
jgi:hypothetical protein